MEGGTTIPSRRNMRTLWLEPAEDWGGHGHDDLEISNTLGLRVKRWYRGFAIRDKPWEARINIVGSKITLRKLVLVFTTTIMVYYFVYLAIPCTGARRKFKLPIVAPTSCSSCSRNKPTSGRVSTFDPPELSDYRVPDSSDTFIDYNYRNNTDCQISSLDLHAPFAPLCTTRYDMLEAISGGGRIGFGSPFMPRGCDMRWFTTEEICAVFSRFEKVIVVGDSMMRHVVGALNVLLRKDLGYGAVTNWNFSPKEKRECFCNKQFDVKDCSVQGIFRTSDVLTNDPESWACPQPNNIDLTIEMMLKFPLDPTEVARFQDLLAPTKPAKPYAFVFGHGLWNDLDLHATLNWLDGILQRTQEAAPYLAEKGALWPRLMVTPNAAGMLKPDQWVQSQGDKALQLFEKSVKVEVAERGVEHLGTWNMSIQTDKFDGVHLDLKGNLVKAMAVVNWLALIDVE